MNTPTQITPLEALVAVTALAIAGIVALELKKFSINWGNGQISGEK